MRAPIIGLMVALVLCLCLAACGSQAAETETTATTAAPSSTAAVETTAAAAAATSASTAAAATEPAAGGPAQVLKVGLMLQLTGAGSEQSAEWKDAITMCQDWINGKGGITVSGQKYTIELVAEDDKGTPPGCVEAATKLVTQEGVKFIVVAALPPTMYKAIAGVTEPAKVLTVTGITDAVSADRPLMFTGRPVYAGYVKDLYDLLQQKYPDVKTLGFMMEDETGARGVCAMSQDVAKQRGLTTLEPVLHAWEATEYYPEWTKLLAMKPDGVDIGLKMPANVANCVKQGRELGFKGPMFGEVGGSIGAVLKMIGDPALATDFFYPAYDPYGSEVSPAEKEMVATWDKTHSNHVGMSGMDHFHLLWFLAQAIEKAQSLDPPTVAEVWRTMDSMETLLGEPAQMGGKETYGINNIVTLPAGISRLVDGKAEFLGWVKAYMP